MSTVICSSASSRDFRSGLSTAYRSLTIAKAISVARPKILDILEYLISLVAPILLWLALFKSITYLHVLTNVTLSKSVSSGPWWNVTDSNDRRPRTKYDFQFSYGSSGIRSVRRSVRLVVHIFKTLLNICVICWCVACTVYVWRSK